jgi:hypothetical protein
MAGRRGLLQGGVHRTLPPEPHRTPHEQSPWCGPRRRSDAGPSGRSGRLHRQSYCRADCCHATTWSQDARAEASHIVTRALANGNTDPSDRTYLAKLIAARAGISQQDAEKRIDEAVTQMKTAEDNAKQAADAARKASASAPFYLVSVKPGEEPISPTAKLDFPHFRTRPAVIARPKRCPLKR